MESIEEHPYKQDDTQEKLIKMYQSQDVPKTVVTLASPGTGKTTTISRIIQALVLKNYKQTKCNFLVLTFTRKTRYDLISKLKKLPGKYEMKKYVRSRVKNFHSFAYDMIEWTHINDDNVETKMINSFLRKLKLNDKDEGKLREQIKRVKDDLLAKGSSQAEWNELIESLKDHHNCHYVSKFLKCYKQWLEKQLTQKNSITYDYSLIKTIEAIKKGQKLKKGAADLDSLELLIVDQFQDSNPAQLKIVQALLQRSKKDVKLLMVGDFDQNIYTWRGADIQYIDEFVRARNPTIMNLGNSYRLGPSLKNLSQALIKSFQPYDFFRRRFYKKYELTAKGKHDQQTEVRIFEKEISEVRWTVDKIYQHMKQGIPLGEMTVLLRSTKTAFARLLVDQIKLRKQKGQPQIFYEIKFYNDVLKSATVKYLFAIFSYFKKNDKDDVDDDDIKRILNPIDHIGEADEVRNEMIKNKKISKDFYAYEHRQNNFQKRKLSWNRFLDDWEKIEEIVTNCSKNGFINVCKDIFQILRDAKWGDLELQQDKIYQFYEVVDELLQSMNEEIIQIDPLFAVYHELSLLADKRQNGEDEENHDLNDTMVRKRKNRLQIQTIHTSKGLQFQVVFLNSLNYQHPYWAKTNRFSIQFATNKLNYHEWTKIQKYNEELRVVYTAITRSSHYCYVNSSIHFERPHWLKKSDIKEHPQFKFLRENGKFFGVIPYNVEIEEAQVDQELQKDKQKVLEMIEKLNIYN